MKSTKKPQKTFDRDALVRCVIGQRVSPEHSDQEIFQAFLALKRLLSEARRQYPLASDTEGADFGYLEYLFRAREAAGVFRYDIACAELLRVVSLEQIKERRVLINLISTLEEFV